MERYGSLMHAKVGDLFLHPPAFVAGSDSIEVAGHRMREINSNALFVRDGKRIGLITGMSLSKAVVLRRLPIQTPVRELASYDIVAVQPGDFVSSALLLMTKYNKQRLAVRNSERYVGISRILTCWDFWRAAPRSWRAASTVPPAGKISSLRPAKSTHRRACCAGKV
jgi:CBS domain-containing protein